MLSQIREVGRGIPTSWTLQIFRIERSDDAYDEEYYNPAELDKMVKVHDDRRHLLWHGMPLDNVGVILKEGLKNISYESKVFFSEAAGTR